MGVRENLIGQTFGYLTVVRLNTITRNGLKWECECICGNTIYVFTDGLKSGHAKSCGCMKPLLTYLKWHPDCPTYEHFTKERKYVTINRYDFKGNCVIGYLPDGSGFLIDERDYESVMPHNWRSDPKGYVITTRNDRHSKWLHRIVLDCPEDHVIDHINHNIRDNRRINLRVATSSQNMINKRFNDINHVTGVRQNRRGKWTAYIQAGGIKYHLGTYDTEVEAIAVRKEAEENLFGDFSYLNSLKLAERY